MRCWKLLNSPSHMHHKPFEYRHGENTEEMYSKEWTKFRFLGYLLGFAN